MAGSGRAETARNPKLRREIAQAQEAVSQAAEASGRSAETAEQAKLRRWQVMSASIPPGAAAWSGVACHLKDMVKVILKV